MAQPTTEKLREIYRTMVRLRTFDQRVTELAKGDWPLMQHPTLGQEAPAVTSCAALNPDDVILPYHRGWAWAVGKGMDPGRILAELAGKRTGYCNGRSGPNLASWELGVLGRPGTQGAHLQIAAGVAHALRVEGKGRVCLAFFGEGASNTGAFHEGLNIASIWDAPVVYICESNGYQSRTPATMIMRVESVAERAPAYRIPGSTIDGNDVLEIYATVSQAIERARRGLGPSLIDCRTYRWEAAYYQPDMVDRDQRPREEIEAWKQKCPIERLRRHLQSSGLLPDDEVGRIQREADLETAAAVRFADESPYPTKAELQEGIYAP